MTEAELENLKTLVQQHLTDTSNKFEAKSPDVSKTQLLQNRPTPFSESTIIEYQIPETVQQAQLFITDLNGKAIKTIALDAKTGQVTIAAKELAAGLYYYTLLLDGEIVDTKKMILTN